MARGLIRPFPENTIKAAPANPRGGSLQWNRLRYPISHQQQGVWLWLFPSKSASSASEEFELKPDKPGFANRCPECSAEEADERATKDRTDAFDRKSQSEANEARRQAIRDLLYRKDS